MHGVCALGSDGRSGRDRRVWRGQERLVEMPRLVGWHRDSSFVAERSHLNPDALNVF